MNTHAVMMAAALAAVSAAPVQADPILPVEWVRWDQNYVAGATNGTATATLHGESITYTGEVVGVSFGYPSWTPVSTFDGGTGIAPRPEDGMVLLHGGQGAINTLTFWGSAWDVYFAVWSLGDPDHPAVFDFGRELGWVVSGGPNAEYGGSSIVNAGNTIVGSEGNGVAIFRGNNWTLSWANPVYENYYGFTVGYAGTTGCPPPPPWATGDAAAPGCGPPVPEPLTLALLGSGLAALTVLERRRRKCI